MQNDACISSAEREEQVTKARPKGNVPVLRFPEFTGEWKRIRVSDLLDFYSTNSLSWEQLEYESNEPYNLHYGLIHVGLPTLIDLIKDELPSIKEGNVPKKYDLCKEGDVAFADASEDTNEVAKVVEFYNLDDKKVVCGLHTIHGRDNNEQTTKGFLGYCFSSTVFHNQIRRIAQGTKIYSISTRNFSEVFVGLPSKSEQQKIATLLRLIDERIATQNKIIEKLETLIKGIVEKTFVSSQYVTLQHYSPIITSGKDQNSGGNYPLYGSTGVIGSVLNPSYNKPIVLIARVGSIGNVQYVTAPCGISDNTLIIDAGEDNRFIYYYLNGYNFSHIISGTTQPLITASSVKKIEIPVIEKHRRKKIVSTLYAIEQKLRNEKYIAYLLSRQKYFLLSQMFI